VDAEALEADGGEELLADATGILVAPGFGDRGTNGMMRAAEIARTRGIPYFGICYGFQWAAVEFARHVCGIANAHSTECAPDTPAKIIYKLRDLLGIDDLGGTMRLGSYACQVRPGSLAHTLYGLDIIHERHRHRYEFNTQFEKALTDKGLQIVGRSLDGKFVEIIEIPGHPWFVAVQFHPEFKSKPLKAHPLFSGFVEAAHKMQRAGGATAERARVASMAGRR
jgi:CTP synthase